MTVLADYRYQQRRMPMPEQARPAPAPVPSESVPAMLYVPRQTDVSVYDESKALEKGTLFPCLNKPFAGKRCK